MERSWAAGLQARLYLLVLLAVIPAFGAIVFYAVDERQTGVAQASRELQRLAQSVALDYQFLVEGERQFLAVFSQLPQIRGDAAACNQFAALLRGRSSRYLNLGVIDRNGVVRCSAVPARPGLYLGDRGYFQDAIKNEGFAVGEFQIGRISGKPSVNFGTPLFGADGAPTAVVFTAVSLSWLSEIVARTPMPEEARTTLLDREGTILLRRPDPEAATGKRVADTTLFQAIRAQATVGVARGTGPTGAQQLVGYAPLHYQDNHIGGYVLVTMPHAVAYAASDQRFVVSLAALAVLALSMWLLARWLGTRLVLRQVYALTDATERFGRGEMSARTGMPHEDSEFGRLARGFDDMAARVERQVADQRRDEERIRRLNRMYVLLSRVSHTIVHQRERAALLEELCHIAVEEGGFRFAWIGWIDQGLRVARPVACHGHDPSFLDNLVISVAAAAGETSNPAAAALREKRVDVCNDIEADARIGPWREAARTRGYRTWGAFPLRMDGRVVAVLNLHSREAGFFDADEQRLVTEVALDISYALDAIEREAQRREAEKRLKFLAYHDPVTELPNLLRYDEMLKDLLAGARADGHPFVLMIVGVERLEEVTATFGHQLEGELLRLMAQRLRQSVRVDDILTRGAGEHFNIVLPNADAELATRTARHLIKVMEQPFSIGGTDLELSIDIGIALFPGHGEELETLDRCAHTAMSEAHKAGGGYAFYSPGQDIFSPERLTLVSELRHAIDNQQLALVFQPKVDLVSREIAGVEALVRWQHPVRGTIPPDQFIAVAEQTGLIRALTYWVMEAAAKQSYNFRRAGYAIPVAINLSTLNLVDPGLPARLQNQCLTWGIDPGAIELEITESSLMQDPAGTFQVLRRLNEMGYLLYIDDFGTGYSSLGYLKKLPVDAL